jgi:hypothetical protein
MMLRCDLDLFGLGYEPVEGSCEHGDEPSNFVKDG